MRRRQGKMRRSSHYFPIWTEETRFWNILRSRQSWDEGTVFSQ